MRGSKIRAFNPSFWKRGGNSISNENLLSQRPVTTKTEYLQHTPKPTPKTGKDKGSNNEKTPAQHKSSRSQSADPFLLPISLFLSTFGLRSLRTTTHACTPPHRTAAQNRQEKEQRMHNTTQQVNEVANKPSSSSSSNNNHHQKQ